MFAETSSKVSELSSRFSSVDKSKTVISASPPKITEHSKIINSSSEQNEEYIQISKKEFVDLKLKVINNNCKHNVRSIIFILSTF